MFEFKVIQKLEPKAEILELLKSFKYKTKKGKIKILINTNLQFIEPTEYLITYPTTLTILEYKVNEISSKRKKSMNSDKVNFLINMINDMDTKNV